MVNYKDALLISGHEVMDDDSIFMFSDSYDGKLNDIQQILLGFYLRLTEFAKSITLSISWAEEVFWVQ